MIYQVYSRAINRQTRELLGYRTEFVDTEKNEMFGNTDNSDEVKEKYEGFWNLNDREPQVIVDKVKFVKGKSKGENWGIKMLH